MAASSIPHETASRWLDPQVVSSLGSLEFLATQVVEGFITGLHTSPFRGYNQEFAEHRPYQVGDELRTVDWKLYGRTNRFYVKQFEADTNLRATLVLDSSASMDFSGEDPPHPENSIRPPHVGLTKFDYARRLVACLAYLLIRQRDAVGLALVDDRLRGYIPARADGRHLRNIMGELDSAQPGGETSLADALDDLASRLSRRALILIASDLLDDSERVAESLKHLRHRKHEVVVFHVMDPREWDLEYDGAYRFKDIEADESIDSDPVRIRADYRREVERIRDFYRDTCLEHRLGYEWVLTNSPLERMLPAFLASRRAT